MQTVPIVNCVEEIACHANGSNVDYSLLHAAAVNGQQPATEAKTRSRTDSPSCVFVNAPLPRKPPPNQ